MGTLIGLRALSSSAGLARFLSEHSSFSRELGRSAVREQVFASAASDTSQALGGFRESVRPSGRQFSVADTLSLGERLNRLLDGVEGVPANSRVREVFRDTADARLATRQFDLPTAAFLNRNRGVLALLTSDPQLRGSFLNGELRTESDIRNALVNAAQSRLNSGSPVTREFLAQNFETTLFIAADIGGIAEVLNADDDLARAFVGGSRAQVEEAVRRDAAREAAKLVGKNSPITEEFLRDNPRAAIYLLQNPSAAEPLRTNVANARQFVATVAQVNQQTEESVDSAALQLVSPSGVLNAEFFASNAGFAETLVADYLTSLKGESLADFLNANAALVGREVNIEQLLKERQAMQAQAKLPPGFPVDDGFLRRNEGIATLVVASERFARRLGNAQSSVERLVRTDGIAIANAARPVRLALTAFASGLPARQNLLDVEA